ncbi:MAG: hypothetical protein LBK43_01180 [Treponema sp.]|nr:hypothetical protein [Treponema sp.]
MKKITLDESNNINIKEYNQFNAIVKPINDTMDIGYLVAINLDYQDRNTVNKINRSNTSFIPKYKCITNIQDYPLLS